MHICGHTHAKLGALKHRAPCRSRPDKKMPWIKSVSGPDAIRADLDLVFEALAKSGAKKIGFAGFCFGGYAAFLASQTSALSCAVGLHSSIKIFNFHGSNEVAAAGTLNCPQMFLQAGNDPENTKAGGDIDKALAQLPIGSQCVFREFKEMKHGWVPRGDLSQAEVRRDVEQAMDLTIAFLDTHLKGSA